VNLSEEEQYEVDNAVCKDDALAEDRDKSHLEEDLRLEHMLDRLVEEVLVQKDGCSLFALV
jgi:hypothetical protein